MLLHEILIHIPSEQNGQTVFTQQQIFLNLDKISFYLKLPMQNQYVALLSGSPLPTPTEIPEEKLLEAGLVEMETTEHGRAFIRVSDILFWTNVELGIYTVVFEGQAIGQNKLSFRTTEADMKRLTQTESIIV